jgi:glyoxylase I family protein
MKPEVSAIDHIYLTVSDIDRSARFYDQVMRLFGFRKGTDPIDEQPHARYFNRAVRITLRPAKTVAAHDPYAPGLHHICLRVADRAAVSAAARGLKRLGIDVTGPRLYPEYEPDYYACFFADPDGIRFELVNHLRKRREVIRKWRQLMDFENPLAKLSVRAMQRGARCARS